MLTIWVPLDAAAKALGAEDVVFALQAEAAKRGQEVTIRRNGSRGMIWLEPLVELETPEGRMGFGPMTPAEVGQVFDANGPLALGAVADLPWMRGQTRLTFARVGEIAPLDREAFQAAGGLAGLRRALTLSPGEILAEVTASGLRGRGGAGFPTGIKWKTVHDAPGAQKYIVCNADEGDSGTFADRMLMEGDPFTLIEGMIIAGIATGARQGYIYSRSEYPDANRMLGDAILSARAAGWLGQDILGAGLSFDLELRVGAGAYVCGEETALLNSLEGKRGTVRAKPPLPALQGFMGRPTVVNNVISLASVPVILAKGAEHYASYGIGRSKGTIPLQIAGNVKYGGLFEAAFGLSLDQIIHEIGGGTASGRPVRAVQVGGPLGAWLPISQFDIPFGYEEYAGQNALIGHAGLTVADDRVDMGQMARFAMEFCAIESCGKCTPCRIGAVRGVETIDRIKQGDPAAVGLLKDLCDTMKSGSLCALGGFTPYPVLSALQWFPEDFGPHLAPRQEAAE